MMNTTHFNIKNFVVIGALVLVLSGCSEYKESFSTTPGTGSGWRSMSETYRFNEKQIKDSDGAGQGAIRPVAFNIEENDDGICGSYQNIKRLPEKTLKVWFAPFQDEINNLYDASVVQTIVQKGSWVARHVKGAV